MPRKPIPVTPRYCRQCRKAMERKRSRTGVLEDRTVYSKRHFCDRTCMAVWMEGQIKVVSARNSRRQSVKTVAPSCELCGRTSIRLHVHHKDHDPLNNAKRNLQTLCGSCHRLSHSPNYTGTPLQRKLCSLCSEPAARKGYCNTHLTRFKKHGDPLMVKRGNASGTRLVKLDS